MKSTLAKKRTTLADVATYAGVSPSTVSLTLSDRSPSAAVRPETRKRILAAVRELNYRPDIRARGLASNRSYLIAMLARKAFDQWTVGIARGIEQHIRERSYSLLSYTYGGSGIQDEQDHLRLSLNRNVDGLIVMPSLDPDGKTNASEFTALKKRGVPIVQLFNRILPNIPAVLRNHARGTTLGMEHLLSLGHQRIVHVTHKRSIASRDASNAHMDARIVRQTYEEMMSDAGLEPCVITHRVPNVGGLGFAQGMDQVVDQILQMDKRPTGIIAYHDYEALGMLRFFHKRGVRVPEDISIIGMDDEPASQVSYPTLSSIRYGRELIGQAGASLLLDLMDGRTDCSDRLIEPELQIRESVGPAAAG